MPIRIMVPCLALLTVLCFVCVQPGAALQSSYPRAITTTPDFGLRRANFRVVTTGAQSAANPARPVDYYRFIVRGIQLQDGDNISFSLSGPDGQVDLGSEDTGGENGSLTLLRSRAKGVLNTAPYIFPRVRILYRKQSRQLIFSSGPGRSQVAVALSANPGVFTQSLTVTAHILRPGETLQDFAFNGTFRILHSVRRRTDEQVYRGSAE